MRNVRTCRPTKNQTMLQLAVRLRARQRAGIASSESLSNTILQYIQWFDPKSGDLNGKMGEILATRRGAPFGNQNRLTHGRRTRERMEFNAEIRAHIEKGKRLISTIGAEQRTKQTRVRRRYFDGDLSLTTVVAT